MSEKARPFKYQELAPDGIRLLKPLGLAGNRLAYQLVEKSISKLPEYAALSYRWGEAGETDTIFVNGHEFAIRPILHGALQQLHRSKLVHKYLWVDAICINQATTPAALEERGRQVTVMTRIYTEAALVLVWLGNPISPTDVTNASLAFQKLKELAEANIRMQVKHRAKHWRWWRPRLPSSAAKDLIATFYNATGQGKAIFGHPGSDTYKAWQGICALWQDPWWTRTWVYQEATIPEKTTSIYIRGFGSRPLETKVKFIWGNRLASWLQMATAYAISSASSPTDVDTAFLRDARVHIERLMRFRWARLQNRHITFLELLQMFRLTECSDPRDKVYAPLCLASLDVRNSIKPDYKHKSTLEVYREVIEVCLREVSPSLDFLGYTMWVKNPPDCANTDVSALKAPSWLPNWQQQLGMAPIPKNILVTPQPRPKVQFIDWPELPSYDGDRIKSFTASGSSQLHARIDGQLLHVRGIFCEVVEDIVRDNLTDEENYAKGYRWGFESKGHYVTGGSFQDALRKTTVMNLQYDTFGRPIARGGKSDLELLDKPKQELTEDEYQTKLNMVIARTKAKTGRNLGRCIGGWMAMLPKDSEAGDGVWALLGGKVLYVLRKEDESKSTYRFIGEAYVHGLMDGQVMKRVEAGEAQIEDVMLI